MNKNMTFCEQCRDDVLYIEKDEIMEANLKGEIYRYAGKIAFCKECNSEVFVSNINDYNLKNLYNEFRKQNNKNSHEHILEIPKQDKIGKIQ